MGKITKKRFEMMAANGAEHYKGQQETDAYIKELNTPTIREFVRISPSMPPERSGRQRTHKVDIYFKFIGKFDIPEETGSSV